MYVIDNSAIQNKYNGDIHLWRADLYEMFPLDEEEMFEQVTYILDNYPTELSKITKITKFNLKKELRETQKNYRRNKK